MSGKQGAKRVIPKKVVFVDTTQSSAGEDKTKYLQNIRSTFDSSFTISTVQNFICFDFVLSMFSPWQSGKQEV